MEQVRTIAHEVLSGVENVAVYGNDSGPRAVGIDLISDMGEVLERVIVSTRGEVLKPALAARLGLSAQMEELARRLRALEIPVEDTSTAWEKEVGAIASEVLAGTGHDAELRRDIEGHWWIGIELFDEERFKLRFRLLATTRGDVPLPLLTEKLGLSAQAAELARRLGALGVQPEDPPLPEAQAQLVAETLDGLRSGLAQGAYPLPELLEGHCYHTEWSEIGDDHALRKVLKQFSQDVLKHLDEESEWPEETEVDRLEAAFADLLEAGIVTQIGQGFTLTLVWESAHAEADKLRERGLEPWGAAVFTEQDIDSALKGDPLYIGFGGLLSEESSEKDARVGHAIVETLRKHGFAPDWNGSENSRIAVLPVFTWRRRRSQVDTIEKLTLGDLPPELVEQFPQLSMIWMRAEGMYLYDLAQMRSDSVEQLTLAHYEDEIEARAALPDVTALVKKRFPRLQTLIIKDYRSFEETIDLSA